jgi:hypothetical protein
MKMIRIGLHRRVSYIEFSDNRKYNFPYRVDKDTQYIPGAYTFIFSGKKDSYDCYNET